MKQHRLDSRKSSAYSTDGIVIIAQKTWKIPIIQTNYYYYFSVPFGFIPVTMNVSPQ